MQLLCNAFNDPSNPWYYVIGVAFLLLFFGALALYIWLSGKKKKKSTDNHPETPNQQDKQPEQDDTTGDQHEKQPEPEVQDQTDTQTEEQQVQTEQDSN